MTALDRLRQRLEVADRHRWNAVALSLDEARRAIAEVRLLEVQAETLKQQVERLTEQGGATPRRCHDCGRSARNLVAVPDEGSVVYLGPQCYQRRRVRGATAEALPIGGAW